jgi:biotin carboxylase
MAHLLIIELPGGNDDDLVKAAISRGDTFVFLTSDMSVYANQPDIIQNLLHAEHLLEIPSFDFPQTAQAVSEQHLAHPFEALLCLLDIRLIDAAKLAELLGLHFLNTDSAYLLRDKYSVRKCLLAAGIEQPLFQLACSNEELQQAVAGIGLPVLIKPSDGYGSQNIVVIEHYEDLAPWISPLEDMLPSKANYGLGVMANDRLLVEQCMQGLVIGCDTFSFKGRHQMLGINEKSFFEKPSFAIRGGCFMPYKDEFSVIQDYVFSLLDATGFDTGAAHTELIVNESGLQLVEINARLVGAKIPRLMSLALHRSVASDLIDLHLGRYEFADNASADVAVTRWITADRSGVLARVDAPKFKDKSVSHVEILKQAGDYVRQPMENADRIGYVMTCSNSRAEAERAAEAFVRDACIVYA